MAGNFNLTAQIHLQAPNAKQFARNLQKQLQNPNIKVNLQNAPKTVKDLNNVTKATKEVEKASRSAGKGADYMGRQLGSAFKQIMKYDIARRVFSLFANAIESGVKDAIAFERAMVKVAQVSGASAREMKALTSEITKVSKQFGVSSQTLARTSLILKQTGLSMRDTKIAMEALAKTELAPTFDNIADTAEMAVAAMRQFGLEASKLEGLLGKINTVAGNFAVESSDIGVAIRRAGGAFKAAGGEVEQLIALFTSVRATTRETAETIATGFRTIFTRLQRPTTIKFLKQFGIELTDLNGKFIGPYQAVERLHGALKGLDPQDLRYSMIVEQLGGFRQVSKVIPLIQQFGTAQAALNAQQAESGSLASDAAKAQATLAVQMQKLTEQVKELFREIVGSDSFQMMAKGALALAEGIVKVGKALAPVIPLITAMAGMKMAGWAMGSMKMFGGRGLNASLGTMGGTGGPGFYNRGGRVRRFSRGGWVPGSGNGDTVPALLEPGEFVLRKSAAQAFGPQLAAVNRYGNGTDPDGVSASSSPVLSKALFQGVYDGDSYRIHGIPSQQKWNTTTRLAGGVDAYEIRNMSSSGTTWGPREKQLGDLAKAMAEDHASKIKKGQDIIGMFGNVDPKKKEKYGRPLMTDSGLANSLLEAGLGETGKATGTLEQRVMEYAKGRTRAGINSGPAGSLYQQWVAEERQKLQQQNKMASGGLVPSLLTPGEFVVNKKSAQRFGYGKLSKMNRYAGGGAVRRYANGTGGAGVLPMGMGGGGMFGGMMMQLGMMEGMFGKVGKAGLGAFNGLTNVASGAAMAYAKFSMVTQSVGVAAQMFGLQSEAVTAFIDRLSMVGGVISSLASVAQNPATQAAFNSAIDWAVNGLMIFGGKLKNLGKAMGGKIGTAVSSAGGRVSGSAAHVARGGTHAKEMYQGIFQRGKTKAFQEKVLKRQEHYKGIQASKTKAAGHATKNMGEWGEKLSASQAHSAKIDADILKNKQSILDSTADIAKAEKNYTALANQRTFNEGARRAANEKVVKISKDMPAMLKKESDAYKTGVQLQEQLTAARAKYTQTQEKFMRGMENYKAGAYGYEGGSKGQSSMKRSGKATMEYHGRQSILDRAEIKRLEKAVADNADAQAKYAKKIKDAEDVVDKMTDVQRNMITKNQALDAALDAEMATRNTAQTTLNASEKAAKELAEESSRAAAQSAKYADKMDGAIKASAKLGDDAAKAGAKAAKLGKVATKSASILAKGSKAIATMGISLVIEEGIAAWGRSMTDVAMTQVKDAGGRMSQAEEEAAVTDAGTGGAISGAATGAGIGVAIGALTGPFAVVLAPLFGVVGAIVGGIWGWMSAVDAAREAIERANFDRASADMADAMKKFGEGTVTASFAVEQIAEMQRVEQGIKDYGVSLDEVYGSRIEQRKNASTILSAQAQGAMSEQDFKNDPAIKRLQELGLVTQKQVDEGLKVVEANVKARAALEAELEARKASNRELRKVAGIVGAMEEASNRLSTFGASIENIATPGSGGIGKTADLFKNAGSSKQGTANFNSAIDMFSNIAGGNSLEGFGKKAKDAQFVNANIEDILTRSGMAGGLDPENLQTIIMDDLERTATEEGASLGPYMKKRMENMINSISEDDLADLENKAPEIAAKFKEDQDRFLAVFQKGAELLDQYTSELEAAYNAQLKLEQEYIKRQQSLMNARFSSDEKFRQNLSASAFSGTSNADVQANFLANQQMLVSGSGGIGGMSAARQASLNAAGGVGNVNAVGATFKQISEDLRANQQQLISQGLDPAALEQTGAAGGLADEQQKLIEKNKELRGEYEAAKQVLENYANSQERLTALNRELEQAQNKRKSLKDLATQARYGTAEEKDQAARLINAITIASQQGIDAVAPELQRQVVGYLPQLMGAQGESIVDQGINDAFGGGQGIAGITEVSAEERRLATEIKAIEDAGITAGEHLAEEVGDRIGDMADKIAELNKNFVIDLRTLFLEEESKQAKADQRTAEAKIAGSDATREKLKEFGIEGTVDAQGNLSYSEEDQVALNNLRMLGDLAMEMEKQEKATSALGGVDLKAEQAKLEGSGWIMDHLASGTGSNIYKALGITKDEFLAGMGGNVGGDNWNVENYDDADMDAMKVVIDKMGVKFAEMGGDINMFESEAMRLIKHAAENDLEGQDVLQPLFQMLADRQSSAKIQGDARMKELEGKVSPEVLEKMKSMTAEERTEYARKAGVAAEVGDLDTFASERNQSYKDLAEAKESLKTVKDKQTKLTDEATKRGSIYTHDIHCQAVLLNILSTLEGQGQTVDMGSEAAKLVAHGVDAMSYTPPKLSPAGKSSDLSKALSTTSPLTDGSLEGVDLAGAITKAVKSLTEGTAAAAVTEKAQQTLAELGVSETAELFSKNIEEFTTAMGSPLSIEVGGSIEVNVNMNGADFLKNAEGALAELAGSEASKAINNFIQQMNKSSNVKPNPQGWHQSGQPKPLTGNG